MDEVHPIEPLSPYGLAKWTMERYLEMLLPPAIELKVLRLAAEGASSEETARRLRKASETVKSQRRAIIAKLRARNIINAVAIGYQRGLLR